jgi:hypothetical protein
MSRRAKGGWCCTGIRWSRINRRGEIVRSTHCGCCGAKLHMNKNVEVACVDLRAKDPPKAASSTLMGRRWTGWIPAKA